MANKTQTDVINTDMDDIKDFSLIRNKICFRLINKKSNNQLLAAIPHRDCYDMAIIYHLNFSLPSDEDAYTIDITNNTLKQWGVDEEQLYELARINTPQLERGYITSFIGSQNDGKEHISFKNFDLVPAGDDNRISVYYATTKRTGNAAVILYDDLLESLSKQIGSFFVMLSSECQCSLTPGTLDDSEKMLKMVRNINETIICKEDILSENCFFYDSTSNKLEIVE